MGSYRVYKLPGSQLSATLILVIAMTIGGIFVGRFVAGLPLIMALPVVAGYLLVMARVWYHALTHIVREIVVHLDGTLEFRAAHRTSTLLPANIRSFKIKNKEGLRTATIEHDRGRLQLDALTPEILNDVVAYVIRINPAVRVVETEKSH